MKERHYHLIRRGDITRIRTALAEVAIRPTDLSRLIDELIAINAEINPQPAFARDRHLNSELSSGGSRRLAGSAAPDPER